MKSLIGLSGFAQVGKDTAALYMPGYQRFAFADPLKQDLTPLLEMIGCDLSNPEHKAMARPLLVEWGRTARRFQPDFWIERTMAQVLKSNAEHVAITDVRYCNEVDEILANGGAVIRIERPGHGPANEEERMSFALIEKKHPQLPKVLNDDTPETLARRVLDQILKEAA